MALGGVQGLEQRQPVGPLLAHREDVAVQAVAGGVRQRPPNQPHRLGVGRLGQAQAGGRCRAAEVPRLVRRHDGGVAVGARRLADLLQVLQGRVDAPNQGASQGERQQGDDDVQGMERPPVGLQAQPGVLPVGKGWARDGLCGGQHRRRGEVLGGKARLGPANGGLSPQGGRWPLDPDRLRPPLCLCCLTGSFVLSPYRQANRRKEKLPPPSFQPYPWVDQPVQQVHHDHHEHQEGAVEHGGAHDHRVVQLLHRLHEVAAQAGDGEQHLHHEAAGGDGGDGRPQHGDDRQDGVAQLMVGEDARGRQALGLGGADEVRIDDLQHGGAHQAGEVGHGAKAQHQGGRQHVRHGAPAGHRQQGEAELIV